MLKQGLYIYFVNKKMCISIDIICISKNVFNSHISASHVAVDFSSDSYIYNVVSTVKCL